MPATLDDLIDVLAEGQRLGFLGDRPVSEVVDHARAFVDALSDVRGRVADIGSGGGVPGLVVALDRPDLLVTLIDRRAKRTDFLARAVTRLHWKEHVGVVAADVDHVDERFDAVIARGFGPPLVTLAAASRLVESGGLVVISEPPTGENDRWDQSWLDANGVVRTTEGSSSVATFRRV